MSIINLSRPRSGLKIAILILGLVGIGIAGYLTYVHYRDLNAICLFNAKCDTVLTSKYAAIWDIPLALYGLVMYLALVGLSIGALKAGEKWQETLDLGIYFISLSGVLFTVYLYYLEIFVLHAFCSWCIGSSIVVVCLLVLSLINLLQGREQVSEKSRSKRFKLSHYIRW